MIIFLYGRDSFRLQQQLQKMTRKFQVEKDPSGLNLVQLDANKEALGKIWEEVQSFPFLADKKMVVIRGLIESKHDELKTEITQKLEEKSFPEHNVVVFCEFTDTFKKKIDKELFARLSQEKYAQNFDFLDDSKLVSWIRSEVTGRGGTISSTAVTYLAQNIRQDMWLLSTTLDQLVAYRGGLPQNQIEVADVQLFLDEEGDNNIFNLVDAIAGKQRKVALSRLRQQYRDGQDVSYLFAMILRQFRILLEIKDWLVREESISSDILAKKLELHPFVVKKSLPLVRQYSLTELKTIYQDLLLMDMRIKTGGGSDRVLLDTLVGKITANNTRK